MLEAAYQEVRHIKMDDAFKEIARFEKKFKLPISFYLKLLDEHDWGFVSKLHSLFEGAATHILNRRLGEGIIELALSHLDFGHTKYRKVTLLSNLDILNSKQVSFLQLLTELRNKLVHRIENVAFSFEDYLRGFDKNKKKSFCDRIGYNCNDPILVAGQKISRNEFIIANPKLSIWLTASDVLACLRVEEEFVNLEKDKRKLELEKLEFAQKINDMNDLIIRILAGDKNA